MDLVQKAAKSQEVRGTGMHCVYLTLSYPMDYARTLIQMGYEPFPPTEYKFFGKPYLALPNTFQYLKYIKSVDGFFGCYRGLAPRLCQSIISQTVYKRIASRNPFAEEKTDNQRGDRGSRDQLKLSNTRSGALIRGSQVSEDFISMAKNTGWEILSVTASTVASQPLYVIAVRTMAQFVGREAKYISIMEAIKTILNEDGVLGFFKGLIPRLIGDAVYISLSASLVYLVCSYVGKSTGPMEGVTVMAANVLASSVTYQFHVVSTVMAVNDAGLAAGHYPFTKKYEDWYECWKSLSELKQLKRGSSVIGRYYTGPTVSINGTPRPSNFYFGPLHPPGLGFRERNSPLYPFIPKPMMD